MASLFQKLRTLFKANLHDVADKALQKSDLAVYDDYIREAEKEVREFKQTIAPMFAQVKTTRRTTGSFGRQSSRLGPDG